MPIAQPEQQAKIKVTAMQVVPHAPACLLTRMGPLPESSNASSYQHEKSAAQHRLGQGQGVAALEEFLTPGKLGGVWGSPGENPRRWYRIGGWGGKPPNYIGGIPGS